MRYSVGGSRLVRAGRPHHENSVPTSPEEDRPSASLGGMISEPGGLKPKNPLQKNPAPHSSEGPASLGGMKSEPGFYAYALPPPLFRAR